MACFHKFEKPKTDKEISRVTGVSLTENGGLTSLQMHLFLKHQPSQLLPLHFPRRSSTRDHMHYIAILKYQEASLSMDNTSAFGLRGTPDREFLVGNFQAVQPELHIAFFSSNTELQLQEGKCNLANKCHARPFTSLNKKIKPSLFP